MEKSTILNSISFAHNFGDRIVEVQCPECGQIYRISEREMNKGKVNCWNSWIDHGRRVHCNAYYFQKYQVTKELGFVRQAIHRVKG